MLCAIPAYPWYAKRLRNNRVGAAICRLPSFLLALASLIIALGRPVSIVSVPAGQATILLTMDVSRSMCSTDIPPNRLLAAEAAALDFIQRQPASTQIGIVAFAGFGELVQPPTSDQEILEDAVESLTTGRRTGIGSGILEALDAIAEIDLAWHRACVTRVRTQRLPLYPMARMYPASLSCSPMAQAMSGPEPIDAAQQAVDRGVRVYTIGFGTAQGGVMNCSLQPGGGGSAPFGGGGGGSGDPFGGGGGGFRRGIDEDTLKQVSDMTGGAYYSAESAGELQEVFQNLPTSLIMRHETTEISFIFTAVGALLAALAIGLALSWHPLP